MARAMLAGYGILIDFNVTTESLTWAIQEDIESPEYVVMYLLLKFFIIACYYDFSNNR
jgi:hypothetical protein